MEAIEFLLILSAFTAVLLWYLRNEMAGSEGLVGMLALRDDPDAAKPGARRRSYRIKPRIAQRAHQKQMDPFAGEVPGASKNAFRLSDEGERMRRRYRRQDEARYRIKDKASRYKSADDAETA